MSFCYYSEANKRALKDPQLTLKQHYPSFIEKPPRRIITGTSIRRFSCPCMISSGTPDAHSGGIDQPGDQASIQKLREAIEPPLLYSKTFATLCIRSLEGVLLLYEPPGCNKMILVWAYTCGNLSLLKVQR